MAEGQKQLALLLQAVQACSLGVATAGGQRCPLAEALPQSAQQTLKTPQAAAVRAWPQAAAMLKALGGSGLQAWSLAAQWVLAVLCCWPCPQAALQASVGRWKTWALIQGAVWALADWSCWALHLVGL